MTTTPATMTPAPPHRGTRNHATEGAAVRILIPGRPQTKDRGHDGRLPDTAKAYLQAVRKAALQHVTEPIDTGVRLDVHLIYVTKQPLGIRAWPMQSIPNGDTAANLTLKALTGILVHHRSQFNPLTITRSVITAIESQDRYRTLDGATILTWEHA